MQFTTLSGLLLCSFAVAPAFAAAVQPLINSGDECDCNIGPRTCKLQVNGDSFYYWVRSNPSSTFVPSLEKSTNILNQKCVDVHQAGTYYECPNGQAPDCVRDFQSRNH